MALIRPILFNIGLEAVSAVFREADEYRRSLALSSGITLRDHAYSNIIFTDDINIFDITEVVDLSQLL